MPAEEVLRGLAEERLSGARAATEEHEAALRSVEVPVRRDAIGEVLTVEFGRASMWAGRGAADESATAMRGAESGSLPAAAAL